MRPATVAAVATAVFSGLALVSTADARSSAKPSASAPLSLNSFMDRAAKPSKPRRRLARPPSPKPAVSRSVAVPLPPRRIAPSTARAPLAPKTIPTIAINARALTVVEADRTAGFASETAPWHGRSAFAPVNEPELPSGIRIVDADEWNELDRAADARAASEATAALPERMALVTPANATESASSRSRPAEREWPQRLYDKFVDGVLAAALAVRSLFH